MNDATNGRGRGATEAMLLTGHPIEDQAHLARLLYRLRVVKGYTQRELAALTDGVHQSAVSAYEAGTGMYVESLLKLLNTLGLRLAVVADGPPPPTTPEAAIDRFARALAGELTEIAGRDLELDGKTWLVTTDVDLAEWLARFAHGVLEPADGDNLRLACLCGQKFTGQRWPDAAAAYDAHSRKMVAEFRAIATSTNDRRQS